MHLEVEREQKSSQDKQVQELQCTRMDIARKIFMEVCVCACACVLMFESEPNAAGTENEIRWLNR